MFIEKDSLQIKKPNGSYVNLKNYILEARYSYNKLWSNDSGRNLAGKQSGTLIGIFPKIIVQFKRLSRTELETIADILDSSKQIVKYYDPFTQQYEEMETYTGDWEIVNKNIINSSHKNEGFTVSFIAIEKRGLK